MKLVTPYLLGLLPLLLVGGWFLSRISGKIARQKLGKFGPASRLPNILKTFNPRARKQRFLLMLAAVSLLIVTAARPLLGPKPDSADQVGAEFFFVLDISKSMLVRDVKPSRLGAVKESLSEWLKTRHGDRIGLILMAGDSFVQAPLTNDYTALRQVLEQSGPRSISIGGTNIPAAVKMATHAMEQSGIKNKAVVIISDGENLEGQAIPAIQDAFLNQKITFFTVGVGTAAGGAVPGKDLGPNYEGPVKEVVRDEYGTPAHSRLDERSLRSIASAGGGRYYSLQPGREKETWDALYNQSLKPLSRKTDSLNLRDYWDLFQIPLILAILALSLEAGVSTGLKNPKRPASAVTLPEPSAAPAAATMKHKKAKRPATASISALLLFFLLGSTPARAATTILTIEEAEVLVKEGKSGEAAEKLRAAAQKSPEDLYLMYNYGIASYAAGKFNEAIDAFSEVSLSRDEKLRSLASMQLGNAQYRLGQDLEKNKNLSGAILALERAAEYYEGAMAERSNKTSASNLAVTKDRLEKNLLTVGNSLLEESWKKPYHPDKIVVLTRAFEMFEKAVKLNPHNEKAAQKLETVRKMLSDSLLAVARDAREKARVSDVAKDNGKDKEQKNAVANQNYQKAREISPENAALATEHDAFKKEVADAFADVAAQKIDEALKPTEKGPEADLRKKAQGLTQALVPLEKALVFDETNTRAQDLKKNALTELEKAHLELADVAKARGELAEAQKKPESAVGDYTSAQQNLQKALAINPDNEQAKEKLADVEAKLASQLTEAGKKEMALAGAPPPPAAPGKKPPTDEMQKDIGHLEKAAATFAQAEALSPGKNDAQALQENANKQLADLRSALDKAQNEKGKGQETAGKGPGEGEGKEGEEPGEMAENSPTKPTLSFSEARAPSTGEGLYRDLRQNKKIRDW